MTDIDWSVIAADVRAVAQVFERGGIGASLQLAATHEHRAVGPSLQLAASLCSLRYQHVSGLLADDMPTPVTGTPCVCVESPLRGDVTTNRLYADCCMFDALARDEAPFLGHLLYPRVLDDAQHYDRERGINAHLAWLRRANLVAVYLDLGLSRGMAEAVELAGRLQMRVVERKLGSDWRTMAEQLRVTRGFVEVEAGQ